MFIPARADPSPRRGVCLQTTTKPELTKHVQLVLTNGPQGDTGRGIGAAKKHSPEIACQGRPEKIAAARNDCDADAGPRTNLTVFLQHDRPG
jgi:hypothetical protein